MIGIGLKPIQYNMYPNWSFAPHSVIGDLFARETLNDTDTPLLYTVGTLGTKAVTKNIGLVLTSPGTGVAESEIRTSGFWFVNQPRFTIPIFTKTASVVDLYVSFQMAQTSATNMFIGLIGNSITELTALPTTAVHMAVTFNSSATFSFSSADGATQTATNSTVNTLTAQNILHIQWSSLNGGLIELLDPNGAPVGVSVTVAALGSVQTYNLHLFIEESAAAAKVLNVQGWYAKWS